MFVARLLSNRIGMKVHLRGLSIYFVAFLMAYVFKVLTQKPLDLCWHCNNQRPKENALVMADNDNLFATCR